MTTIKKYHAFDMLLNEEKGLLYASSARMRELSWPDLTCLKKMPWLAHSTPILSPGGTKIAFVDPEAKVYVAPSDAVDQPCFRHQWRSFITPDTVAFYDEETLIVGIRADVYAISLRDQSIKKINVHTEMDESQGVVSHVAAWQGKIVVHYFYFWDKKCEPDFVEIYRSLQDDSPKRIEVSIYDRVAVDTRGNICLYTGLGVPVWEEDTVENVMKIYPDMGEGEPYTKEVPVRLPSKVCFSPDGRYVAMRTRSARCGERAYLLDAATLKVISEIKSTEGVLCIGFSVQGKYLLVSDYDARGHVIELDEQMQPALIDLDAKQ